MIRTRGGLIKHIVGRARREGFTAERVVSCYGNRVQRSRLTLLVINGWRCAVYHLKRPRVSNGMCYGMLGVRRTSLQKTNFVFVHCLPAHGLPEMLFIVPTSKLLKQFREGEEMKRFYIPYHESVYSTKVSGRVSWFLYRDDWSRLAVGAAPDTSATG